MAKDYLYGKTLTELQTICAELQQPRFVAKQIADWLYRKNVRSIDEMTNLSKVARAALSERFELGLRAPEGEQTSSDGTKKYLYRTSENEFVESAYIPDRERATLCVSSQAGCRMGCKFCASTLDGLDALLATVQMPSGMPVATVAINGAANAALLAVQILAVENEELAEKLVAYRKKASDKVLAKNAEIEAKYNG